MKVVGPFEREIRRGQRRRRWLSFEIKVLEWLAAGLLVLAVVNLWGVL